MSDVFPKVLNLSSEVDECKPLSGGHALAQVPAHSRHVRVNTLKTTLQAAEAVGPLTDIPPHVIDVDTRSDSSYPDERGILCMLVEVSQCWRWGGLN